jgi:hypothetical protein
MNGSPSEGTARGSPGPRGQRRRERLWRLVVRFSGAVGRSVRFPYGRAMWSEQIWAVIVHSCTSQAAPRFPCACRPGAGPPWLVPAKPAVFQASVRRVGPVRKSGVKTSKQQTRRKTARWPDRPREPPAGPPRRGAWTDTYKPAARRQRGGHGAAEQERSRGSGSGAGALDDARRIWLMR